MELQNPLRDIALHRLRREFAEPETVSTRDGPLFRWVLDRPGEPPLRLMLNAPELPRIAHLIITDAATGHLDPTTSILMRTQEELEAVIRQIRVRLDRPAAK